MNNLEEFLTAVDLACYDAMKAGMPPAHLAGALLARVTHLYLVDGEVDLEGLESLLRHALDQIANRPRYNIE